jgi:hypothetical protein
MIGCDWFQRLSFYLPLGKGIIEKGEVFNRVFLVEDGRSRDDEVRLHCRNFWDSGLVDTAIDTDEEFRFPLKEGFNFGGNVFKEEFFARVGANTKEKNVVNLIEVVFYEAGGGAGIQRDATEDVFVCGNTREGVIDMGRIFYREGDEICPGFCKGIDVLFWFVDEEMNILKEVGLKSGDEWRANGDIGPDISVHDIEVKKINVVFFQSLEGCVLVSHVSAESSDGELWARTDEVDFFGACHV